MTDIPVSAPRPLGRYHCPACGALMIPTAPCPTCRRPADPQAAQLVRLDGELAALTADMESTRRHLGDLATTWQTKAAERGAIAQSMTAAVVAERSRREVAVPSEPPLHAPGALQTPPHADAARR